MPLQPIAESKVAAGALAGASTAVLFWIGGYFAPDFMAAAPAGIEATVASLLGALAAWYMPDRTRGASLRAWRAAPPVRGTVVQ